MKAPVNAILIDVKTKTVQDIMVVPDLKGMYKAINCRCVGRIELDSKNDLWYDDESLLGDTIPPAFTMRGWSGRIHGNGLILGYTREGDSIETRLTAERLKPIIRFL